jgi:hypothetical protein
MNPLRMLLPLLLTIPSLAATQTAKAVPMSLAVDPTATNLTLRVSSSAGSAETPFAVSGVLSSEVVLSDDALFGTVVTQLQLLSGQLDASHDPLSILGAGVSLTFSSANLGMSLTGPAVSATPVAPGFSIGDFRDNVVALDRGTIFIIGHVLAEPIDDSLDLTLFPLELTLPINSIGQIRVVEGAVEGAVEGIAGLDVDITVPIDATSRLFIAGLDIDVSLTGNVVLKNSVIPEPGTGVLVATGLAIAGAARRRRAI